MLTFALIATATLLILSGAITLTIQVHDAIQRHKKAKWNRKVVAFINANNTPEDAARIHAINARLVEMGY